MNVILSPTEQLLAENMARPQETALESITYDDFLLVHEDGQVFSRYPKYSYPELVRRASVLTVEYADFELPIVVAAHNTPALGTSGSIEGEAPTSTVRMSRSDAIGLVIATAFHAYPIKKAAVIDLEKATSSELELKRTNDSIYDFYVATDPGERVMVIDASSNINENSTRRAHRLIAANGVGKILRACMPTDIAEVVPRQAHPAEQTVDKVNSSQNSRKLPGAAQYLSSIVAMPGNRYYHS